MSSSLLNKTLTKCLLARPQASLTRPSRGVYWHVLRPVKQDPHEVFTGMSSGLLNKTDEVFTGMSSGLLNKTLTKCLLACPQAC